MNQLRKEATQLRRDGYSYGMIREKLGLSKSTLSNWFSRMPFEPNEQVFARMDRAQIKSALQKHRAKLADIEMMQKIGISEVGKLSPRDVFMLGVGLYLGEGSKSNEEIRVVNSDPKILKIAKRWLSESLRISPYHLHVTVHGYPDTDPGESMGFWSEELQIPLSQFGKMVIDARKDKSVLKRNKLPYGTAHLSVRKRGGNFSVKSEHRRIMGWLEATIHQIENAGMV